MEIETTTNGGSRERYCLEGATLQITRAEMTRADHLLNEVKSVRLASLGAMRICELGMKDGSRAAISTEKPTPDFTSFVAALHKTILGLGQPVRFIHGSWLLVVVNASIGLFAVALGLALRSGFLTPPDVMRSKAFVAMYVGLAWMFVGPLLVWRSRPRSYDPSSSANLTT